jgi:hypothetical protein
MNRSCFVFGGIQHDEPNAISDCDGPLVVFFELSELYVLMSSINV